MSGLLGEIGTIEWSRRTNGILSRGERARFVTAVLLTTSRILPRLLGARAGLRGSGPDPSALTLPDTPFARDVLGACGDLDPMIVEHGLRSYLFARALGVAEGVEADDEALFAAAVLHDYAFGNMDELTDRCFTLAGAEVAADLLAASPLSEDCATTCSTRSRCTSTRAWTWSAARCSTSSTTGSCSTCSASAPGTWTPPVCGASSRSTRATGSPSAASRCCARTASGCTAAARARCSRRASVRRCGPARGGRRPRHRRPRRSSDRDLDRVTTDY